MIVEPVLAQLRPDLCFDDAAVPGQPVGMGLGRCDEAVADGELRLVRADQMVKPGWADRFHDAMKKKKAEKKG